jgi:hypothetical protein
MHLSSGRKASRLLPKRFPVGTTYVVEGRRGANGHLWVFSRYVVLPGGQRINLGGDFGGPAASRARRSRSRGETPSQNTGKRRHAGRVKKIVVGAGTPRRHGR